jgi:hypothetical protein
MADQQIPFCNPHNNAADLAINSNNVDFHQILNFLRNSHIYFALTTNPDIYEHTIRAFWRTAQVEVVDGETHIRATIAEREVIVSEQTIRAYLMLNDAEGINSIPNNTLLDNLALMGYEGNYRILTFQKALLSPQWKYFVHILQTCISKKRSTWNEFNVTIATALICLATGRTFNFSKMIFNDMIVNLNSSLQNKFLMYPRFIQRILDQSLGDFGQRGKLLALPPLTKKTFSNMLRVTSKAFSGEVTPLFSTMVESTTEPGEGSGSVPDSQPTYFFYSRPRFF